MRCIRIETKWEKKLLTVYSPLDTLLMNVNYMSAYEKSKNMHVYIHYMYDGNID